MDTIIAAPSIENLSLTDLIDLETLQLIQESFSSMAGVASLITDKMVLPSQTAPVSPISAPNMCVSLRRAGNGVRNATGAGRRIPRRRGLPAPIGVMQDLWTLRFLSLSPATR